MNHFFIIANRQKDMNLALSEQIRDYLAGKGAVCEIYGEHFSKATPVLDVPKDTECILVIGGDGTLLEAASLLVGRDIPLLGVNLGTLGFLAEVNPTEVFSTLDQLLLDNYNLEKRIMIRADISREGKFLKSYTALNDLVVTRYGYSKIIGLSLSINDFFIERYHADGVILCTPTGSTGYNLSAGGPIINPTCKNFVLTPICPHSLMTRSVVLAKDDVVTVRIERVRTTQREEAIITFDGREGITLSPGDEVRIQKAEEVTPFIKTKAVSFMQILRDKLS